MKTSPSAKTRAQKYGVWAERWCAGLLRLKGYRILGRNVRLPGGEIDIICRKGHLIAFVEVKYREAGSAAEALAAISPTKQNRLSAAASHYLARQIDGATVLSRFDAMVVLGSVWQWAWRTQHIPDAFRP